MRLGEEVIFGMILIGTMIAVPWLAFALASLFAGFPKLRIHQVLGMVGAVAWVFALVISDGPRGGMVLLVILSAVIILMSFAAMWSEEFRFLMLRRSDEFPDRLDKLAWVFVLTAMAPAGVWLFRSYRRARWPEPAKAVGPHPLDEPDPVEGIESPEFDRIGA